MAARRARARLLETGDTFRRSSPDEKLGPSIAQYQRGRSARAARAADGPTRAVRVHGCLNPAILFDAALATRNAAVHRATLMRSRRKSAARGGGGRGHIVARRARGRLLEIGDPFRRSSREEKRAVPSRNINARRGAKGPRASASPTSHSGVARCVAVRRGRVAVRGLRCAGCGARVAVRAGCGAVRLRCVTDGPTAHRGIPCACTSKTA
jgi:hypothetical protein